ncbi:O-antigen ligase family protein [uncultured Bacteroides sp.]|uniref:O-antigen ligase family protein n=1 Tax=uncultured Bacteroides sp. TaxID=162156 RepID=UPI002AAB9E9D|nr:O-antigen ligase family protein [uncultured Bacteroides sp.]
MLTFIKNITKLILPKIFVYAGLLIFIVIFYKATMQRGCNFGYIIVSMPFVAVGLYLLLKNPLWSFIILFICNYFIMGITRYITLPVPISVFMDSVISFIFLALILKTIHTRIEWKRVLNPLTLIIFIWLIFCIIELLNPKLISFADWFTKVRSIAFYPIILIVLVSVLLNKYKHIKLILLMWSVLTLLAALKGYWQKNHGFDSAELIWLYNGGAKTHFISTGIRYFSFFSDAGNYGSNMGFSLVVFSIAAFYIKNKWLKIYFLIVALAGGYGMVISGTRGALAVPFAGYAIFILLSKKWEFAFYSLFILVSAICFLNFTTIGNNNQTIKRMRSGLDTNDASLNVRLENQKKLKEYLKDLPFGAGIGFGNTPDINSPDYEFSGIPSDSWLVRVWIQTGVVGLSLYIILLSAGIISGGYIILFKIKDKELGGVLAALLAGVVGMTASASGNEILGQYPTCYLYFICFAIVFMGKYYDKELEEHEQLT